MARYYQTAIVPARPYKPKDKAKVETAVQIVERWILARLRHHSFFTLASLNQAIGDLLGDLNQRPFKKLPGCRRSQFEQIDLPALNPLPTQPYQYVDIKQARVHIDYHIEYDKHYYSVPHHLVRQPVMVHASSTVVSIYAYGKRVATHPRSWRQELVDHLLQQKRHKEQTYRQILALLSNAKKYGRDRLNNACARALHINSPTRRSVESILSKGIDRIPPTSHSNAQSQEDLFLDEHENLRGEKYYH
jgi:hypothetical protein